MNIFRFDSFSNWKILIRKRITHQNEILFSIIIGCFHFAVKIFIYSFKFKQYQLYGYANCTGKNQMFVIIKNQSLYTRTDDLVLMQWIGYCYLALLEEIIAKIVAQQYVRSLDDCKAYDGNLHKENIRSKTSIYPSQFTHGTEVVKIRKIEMVSFNDLHKKMTPIFFSSFFFVRLSKHLNMSSFFVLTRFAVLRIACNKLSWWLLNIHVDCFNEERNKKKRSRTKTI